MIMLGIIGQKRCVYSLLFNNRSDVYRQIIDVPPRLSVCSKVIF